MLSDKQINSQTVLTATPSWRCQAIIRSNQTLLYKIWLMQPAPIFFSELYFPALLGPHCLKWFDSEILDASSSFQFNLLRGLKNQCVVPCTVVWKHFILRNGQQSGH